MLNASSRRRTECSDGQDVQQELVYLSLIMIDVQELGERNFEMYVCKSENREAGFFLACKSLNTTILTLRNLVSRPPGSFSALSCRDPTTPLPDMVYRVPNHKDRLNLHLLPLLMTHSDNTSKPAKPHPSKHMLQETH